MNEAITTEEPEKIKEALERLKNSGMEIGKAIYAQGESTQEEPAQETQSESTEEPKEEEKKDEEKK